MADKIDMAAAGMTITEARQEEIDFSGRIMIPGSI
jgi:ABC-type amino acid transport substrate-binding protein